MEVSRKRVRPYYTHNDFDPDNSIHDTIKNLPWLMISGVRCNVHNIVLLKRPDEPISKKKIELLNVSGRNGNIAVGINAFENIDISYEIGITFPPDENIRYYMLDTITQWLHGDTRFNQPDYTIATQYLDLRTSFDEYHYRKGIFIGPSNFKNNLLEFGNTTLTFSCLPQKYLYPEDKIDAMDIPNISWGNHVLEKNRFVIDTSGNEGLKTFSRPRMKFIFKKNINPYGVELEISSSCPSYEDIGGFDKTVTVRMGEPDANNTYDVWLDVGEIISGKDSPGTVSGLLLCINDIRVTVKYFGNYNSTTIDDIRDLFDHVYVEPGWYV